MSFKSYRVLIKERDGDDHGDDDDHGLCLKTFSMNMCNISKSYTKTEHTIDKQHSQNGDRCSVSYYKCIFLFSLKFSLHNCDVLCRQKAKPYISVLKSCTTTRRQGVIRKWIWKYGGTKRPAEFVRYITKFRIIEVLFHIFYYYWSNENRLLYRGL